MKTTIRGVSVRDVSVISDVAVDLSLYFTEEKHHSYYEDDISAEMILKKRIKENVSV